MRILLIGTSGQLGSQLLRAVQPLGKVLAANRKGKCTHCIPCAPLDLTNTDRIHSLIKEFRPNIVINAAAYTAVDRAESEPKLAFQINETAVADMAEAAKKANALLIHYSTDYVFDGAGVEPYTEESATNPAGVYGASKLAGEQAIADIGGHHLILRTSWVYSAGYNNFLTTMFRLASQRDTLSIVYDQIGTPTWSAYIAQTTAALLSRISPVATRIDWEEALAGRGGVYHLACTGETSWHGFASELLEQAFKLGLVSELPRLVPITTEQYPTPAIRPAYTVLDSSLFARKFGFRGLCWEEALGLCINEMLVPGSH